jgi:hypothetical protein
MTKFNFFLHFFKKHYHQTGNLVWNDKFFLIIEKKLTKFVISSQKYDIFNISEQMLKLLEKCILKHKIVNPFKF